MRLNIILAIAFSTAVLSIASASYLNVEGPITATLYNNGSLYLGKVGPGESFYILGNSSTTNSKGTIVNIGWDSLSAVSLPQGWSSQQSPLYENPMKTKITVAPNAANGTYEMVLKAINIGNYSGLGNLTVKAYVNVTTNVFNLGVSPLDLVSGINQPANLYVTINNTGISDDPFIISVQGLPGSNLTQQVISLHSTKNTFVYPVYAGEPGIYNLNLTVSSSSSPLIKESYHAKLSIKESLSNDYNAVGNGVILSPVIFEPAYAIMSLLYSIESNLFH
jgi:hypothetical protein